MKLYPVIYTDGSWSNTGDHLIAIFDDEERAKKLCDKIAESKNHFKGLSGSSVNYCEYELNEFDDSDMEYIIEYYC